MNIPADQLEFEIYDNPRGKPNCQGKIAYRGPVSPTSGGWPKIKLDLTADERLVLASVRREVFHPYSDKPEGGIRVLHPVRGTFLEELVDLVSTPSSTPPDRT